jgi:hypothetical protein
MYMQEIMQVFVFCLVQKKFDPAKKIRGDRLDSLLEAEASLVQAQV